LEKNKYREQTHEKSSIKTKLVVKSRLENETKRKEFQAQEKELY